MAEHMNSELIRGRLGVLKSGAGMLQCLAGLFVPRFAVLLSVLLLSDAMCVRRDIVQLGRPLMILVMRALVITCRHDHKITICPDLSWASLANLYA